MKASNVSGFWNCFIVGISKNDQNSNNFLVLSQPSKSMGFQTLNMNLNTLLTISAFKK
jgi:hypothetical protein